MQYVCWRRTCRYDVFSVMLLVLGVLYAFLVYWLAILVRRVFQLCSFMLGERFIAQLPTFRAPYISFLWHR